jgi:16S rRNA G1207 methylase RsmC
MRSLVQWFHAVDIQDFPIPEKSSDAQICCKRARDAPDESTVSKKDTVLLKWTVAPGLFAGGVVDIMTLAMMKCLDPPRERSKNLDFACGSGIITKWLLLAEPACSVTMCDNDTVALEVAKINNPKADAVLSDSWDSVPQHPSLAEGSLAFDNIYSNPPLHRGDRSVSTNAIIFSLLIRCRTTRRFCCFA